MGISGRDWNTERSKVGWYNNSYVIDCCESAKDINVTDLCECGFHGKEKQHKFMIVVDLSDLGIHCMLGQMNNKSFVVERAPCLDTLFRIPICPWSSFISQKASEKRIKSLNILWTEGFVCVKWILYCSLITCQLFS
jgi:hypothetical protein